MEFIRRYPILLVLGCFLLYFSGCTVAGGGGGVQEERKIAGVYQTDSGKTIVFDESGSYQYYFSKEDYQSRKTTINSTYTIIQNSEIRFNQDDGSAFEESGILAEDDKSFTWAEHPGETFKKIDM